MEAVMKIKEGGNTRKKACRFFTLRDHTSMSKADKSALARANFLTFCSAQPYRRYPPLMPLALDVHELYW
jgi:hypothetical protein